MALPKLKVVSSEPSQIKAEALVLFIPAGTGPLPQQAAALDAKLGGAIKGVRKRGEFRGAEGESLRLIQPSGVKAPVVVLLGVGEEPASDDESRRRQGAAAARTLAAMRIASPVVVIETPKGSGAAAAATAIAEGMALAAYKTPNWKREEDAESQAKRIKEITVAVASAAIAREVSAEFERMTIILDSVFDARDLGNTPANFMTPSDLAAYARRVARETGAKVKILGVPEMKKLKMGAILGVAQGSKEPPRTIVMEHRPRGAKRTIAIVGKGVTFDSGGISLKPWKPMWDMKYDMCGAAAVLAAFRALVRLQVKTNIVAIVGAVENLPDGNAYKPGDIVVAGNGKSIEIHSTDAEGRVVLADMLHHARSFDPDYVIDFATLTGAVVTALGHHCSSVMGNDQKLADELKAAGERTGDRLVQFPLWDEYGASLKSQVADVCNTGDGAGGSIQGGWFLKNFVDFAWCHVDIAGTAWIDADFGVNPKGGTGFGTRLIVDLVTNGKL